MKQTEHFVIQTMVRGRPPTYENVDVPHTSSKHKHMSVVKLIINPKATIYSIWSGSIEPDNIPGTCIFKAPCNNVKMGITRGFEGASGSGVCTLAAAGVSLNRLALSNFSRFAAKSKSSAGTMTRVSRIAAAAAALAAAPAAVGGATGRA